MESDAEKAAVRHTDQGRDGKRDLHKGGPERGPRWHPGRESDEGRDAGIGGGGGYEPPDRGGEQVPAIGGGGDYEPPER
jgi:hypothetical protein